MQKIFIAWFNFPDWVEIALTENFGGSKLRFRVRNKNNPKKEISIYYDDCDALEIMRAPYWELYPNADGDCDRFYSGKEKELEAKLVELLK